MNMCPDQERAPRRCGSVLYLVLALAAIATQVQGEEYPLPPWFFYGGGDGGTWSGSSSSPDNADLTSQIYQSGPRAYATAVAQSSDAVLVITSNTTYSLRFAGSISGIGSGNALFVGDFETVASASVTGSSWKNYTNAFTTAGPADARVGKNLHVQILLNRFGTLGTATGSFTNIQLHVDTSRPVLAVRTAGAGQIQLRWLTNFNWYVPEIATSISAVTWEPVTNSPTVQSNQFVIQLGVQPGPNFFRLRQD